MYTLFTHSSKITEVDTDWKGELYSGITTIKWNYDEGWVDLSMPGYVKKALQRFQHPTPTRPEKAPHIWIPPKYGAPVQYAQPED